MRRISSKSLNGLEPVRGCNSSTSLPLWATSWRKVSSSRAFEGTFPGGHLVYQCDCSNVKEVATPQVTGGRRDGTDVQSLGVTLNGEEYNIWNMYVSPKITWNLCCRLIILTYGWSLPAISTVAEIAFFSNESLLSLSMPKPTGTLPLSDRLSFQRSWIRFRRDRVSCKGRWKHSCSGQESPSKGIIP